VRLLDDTCFGDAPGLADICLIPQLVNARRFGVELTSERLLAIEAACLAVEAFRVPEGLTLRRQQVPHQRRPARNHREQHLGWPRRVPAAMFPVE
jgi:glutathione S-transferase